MPSQDDPRFLTMDGEIVDPFDSLDSMIKHEDLHKFVLFKTHYRKYMDVSMAYEDLMGRIESYEEELDHVKTQEMKAMEDLETLQTLLREKEVLLQKKEDELFSADEKITQLECDLDEERGRGSKLKLDLAQLIEEKQNLAKQHQAILREKNEIQLRLQVEKSKSSEDEISRSENSRLAKNLDDVTKDREKWRTKWEDLYTKVKSLESLWRETRELQGLLRAGIEHLANCSRPSSCRMCCRVRDSYIKNGLVQTSNGNKDGQLLDSRRKHANLLRTQYQRLTHLIGTLLPAPIATFDPGLDGPLPSKDDSGFVDVDVDDTDDGIDGASPCSTLQRRIPRRKSFNGVPDRLINGTASKEPQATSPGTPPSATGATGATAATSTAKKSAFTRMSRLTKSFGYAERGRKHLLTSPNGSPEHALEEDVSSKGANNNGALRKGAADVEGDENDEGGFVAVNGATSNGLNGVHGKGDVGHKHKLGPVRKFFSRMSVSDAVPARPACELSDPSCSSTGGSSMLDDDHQHVDGKLHERNQDRL